MVRNNFCALVIPEIRSPLLETMPSRSIVCLLESRRVNTNPEIRIAHTKMDHMVPSAPHVVMFHNLSTCRKNVIIRTTLERTLTKLKSTTRKCRICKQLLFSQQMTGGKYKGWILFVVMVLFNDAQRIKSLSERNVLGSIFFCLFC